MGSENLALDAFSLVNSGSDSTGGTILRADCQVRRRGLKEVRDLTSFNFRCNIKMVRYHLDRPRLSNSDHRSIAARDLP